MRRLELWDGVGACGFVLVLLSAWAIAGWPWSIGLLGLVLSAAYVYRELRLAAVLGRDGR